MVSARAPTVTRSVPLVSQAHPALQRLRTLPTVSGELHCPVRDRRVQTAPCGYTVCSGYIDWHLNQQKVLVYKDLPDTIVELGSGVGANLRYLRSGTKVIAIEPNPYMQAPLRRAAAKRGIDLELRDVTGEKIDLPDASADAVISSLVLCTVDNPAQVVAEVRRILRPGGKSCFAEQVPHDTSEGRQPNFHHCARHRRSIHI